MGRKFDTLDDVDVSGVNDISDVYHMVLGQAMAADDLCGVITTGPLNQSQSPSGHWGFVQLSFKDHPEVWFVRSAPAGRIGLPLKHNEVRQVSVLVLQSAGSKHSIVTNIKLWRRPDDQRVRATYAELDLRQRDRGWATLGPLGVSTHGIHLFEQRAGPGKIFYAPNGTHCVLPSIATITRPQDNGTRRRVEAMPMPQYILAASMLGLPFVDSPTPRGCEAAFLEDDYATHCTRNAHAFRNLYKKHLGAYDANAYVKVMVSAEEVLEQISFIGYLDQRADPFYVGAMPDDMHKPSGMPFMLAAAVCVACTPEQWGLPMSRGDDAFATKEARLFIESLLPAITSKGNEHAGVEWTPSIDIVVNFGLAHIKELVRKLESGQLVGELKGVDHKHISRAMKATMSYLQYTGTAVCVDLFGLPPTGHNCLLTRAHGVSSHHLLDPVLESRRASAHVNLLGNVVPRWPTQRTSTRGKRQLALASVLVDVDEWLRTGMYRGMALHPTAEASVSVRPEELDPAAAPPAPAPATRSSKKKKKPEALLAERGRQRGARQQCAATDAVRCMFGAHFVEDWRILKASKKLCGEAVTAAAAIFGDVLQQGACVGMDDLFKFQTHLVAPTSKLQCAHCENTVDVVESIAFSGTLGNCAVCGHPRCLECVAADIAALGAGGLVQHAECRFCKDQH